jgi:5-methylcytosine-specific restriction endonuclease McrA
VGRFESGVGRLCILRSGRHPLQKDCVLAISRGGRYELANVVPCCRSCNTSKCNTEVTNWMRRKKLDEARFLLRQAEINRALAAEAG